MSLRFHEIAEARHRILNPFTAEKLALLGEICELSTGMRQLDLACGKAELLCGLAKRYGTTGIGVDISEVFLAAARDRAEEVGVSAVVEFVHDDAGKYQAAPAAFDLVSCIGATWIGGGLVGTLELMKPALKDDGLLMVGEPYWIEPPPVEAPDAIGIDANEFVTLDGTLDRFEAAGTEPVEMVLADNDSWDRYVASQWMTGNNWLREHPDDPDAAAFRKWISDNRRAYFRYGRRYLGWGVFLLRLA